MHFCIRNSDILRSLFRYAWIFKKDLYDKVHKRFDMEDCKSRETLVLNETNSILINAPK